MEEARFAASRLYFSFLNRTFGEVPMKRSILTTLSLALLIVASSRFLAAG